MLRYLFVIFIIHLVTVFAIDLDNNSESNPNYLVLTPSKIVSGGVNKICVSRFGIATLNRATAHIEVLPPSIPSNISTDGFRYAYKYIARSRKIFPEGNGGCFDILVPRTPHRTVILRFRMRLEKLPQYKVDERREVTLHHDSSIAVVQLDKPIYRAGETVKLRVLQLRQDLTPLQLPVFRISIETPPTTFGGPVKVVQWFNVSTQQGIVLKDYVLDKYAQQGEWRVVVDNRDSAVSSVVQPFAVTDYVLPKYYLTVESSKFFLATFKQSVYQICARYMYGEGVNGKLDLNIYSDSFSSQKVHFETHLTASQGCFNYSVWTKSLGFADGDVPKMVILDIGFQEEGTREWKNKTAISHLSPHVVKVNFVHKHDIYFKPGLPYKVKVRVSDWNGNPVESAKVQFCKILNQHPEEVDNAEKPAVLHDSRTRDPPGGAKSMVDECQVGDTDTLGHASFTFSIEPDDNTEFVQLKAIVIDHPLRDLESNRPDQRFATASRMLYSWGNYSSISMEIGAPLAGVSELRLGSRHSFPIFLTLEEGEDIKPITLHYAIVTRLGTIFNWGTTTQCPTTIHDERSTQRARTSGTQCPAGAARAHTVYKVAVHMRVWHHMCPHSHLLVYHAAQGRQLGVASKRFRVEDCFNNKVSQEWIPATVAPSSATKLQLRSTGPALCLLAVTSSALNLLAPHPTVHQQILHKLSALMHAKQSAQDTEGLCFSDRSPQTKDGPFKHFMHNTVQTFLSIGIDIMSDLIPRRVKCSQPQPLENKLSPPEEMNFHDQFPKIREDFPETWLWEVYVMDSKGILEIPAVVPDEITQWESEVYCVSRSGIAVPQKNQSGILKVMQPFFVDLQTPRTIKRGEDVQIYYKVFNYLDQDIPITIDLEITAGAVVTAYDLNSGTSQTSCLPRGRSIVHHFTLMAQQLRSVNVSVAVQILNSAHHLCPGAKPSTTLYDIRDKILKQIIVEPEGFTVEHHKSALMCADDVTNKTDLIWTFERNDCVDQSENWFVSIVGDITGPMAMNVENLISLPMGCGEQNLALMAYNLIALDYALAGKRVSGDMREKALQHLSLGYQRQLRFVHPSGAFSAFGPSDLAGSTWLTAFGVDVLRGLPLPGVQPVLEAATRWLLALQMENGCFRNEGQVFHREMKGGLRSDTSSIALAAYVVISLIDSKTPQLKPSVVQNTAYCLAALKYNHIQQPKVRDNGNAKNADKMYTFALATLAQIKIEKYNRDLEHKNEVTSAVKMGNVKRQVNQDYEDSQEFFLHKSLRVLVDSFNEEDGYFNSSSASENVLMSPVEDVSDSGSYEILQRYEVKEADKGSVFLAGGANQALQVLKSLAHRDGDLVWWEAGSLSVSIETTGYAMLSLLALGGQENIMDAVSAARWLSLHRTSQGGFLSTQDTLVALRALCELRQAMPMSPPSVGVAVRGPGRGRLFSVAPAERHKLHTVVLRAVDAVRTPSAKLSIAVEGRGCLLVQATQKYNTLQKPVEQSPFRLFPKVLTDGTFACQANNSWCQCAATLEVCVSWNSHAGIPFPEMALLEVQLPTGYAPDRSLLYKLLKPDSLLLRRIEESSEVSSIFMYLALHTQLSSIQPHECYTLYLVGFKGHTQPAAIRVMDYYHTDVAHTTSYSIPEACSFDGDRRPHEEPMMLERDPMEDYDGGANTGSGQFGPDWHVVDTDYDLETPKTIEGVPAVYALPPPNFNASNEEENPSK